MKIFKLINLMVFALVVTLLVTSCGSGDTAKNEQEIVSEYSTFSLGKLENLAAEGDELAQFALGFNYLGGFFGEYYDEIDYLKAISYFQPLEEKGNSWGQVGMALMYFGGRGVKENQEEAFRLVRLAAKQNNPFALGALAGAYETGDYLPQDYQESLRLYRKAAELGNYFAAEKLAKIYEKGTLVEKNKVEALKWTKRSAELGNLGSQKTLGDAYFEGNEVLPDYEEAIRWYTLAADQMDMGSMVKLGEMYRDGKGAKDFILAHMWFNLATSRGSSSGERNRERIEQEMDPKEIIEAQKLAREWTEEHQ